LEFYKITVVKWEVNPLNIQEADDKKKIRVMLADDHQLIRQELVSLLEGEDLIEVVGEAFDGLEAVRLALGILPDVVVMDIGMPHMNGIEATREILRKNPDIKIIALSMHDDSISVEAMLKHGARGYVLKSDAYEELVSAIHSVVKGENYLGKGIETSSEEFSCDNIIWPIC
jgi:two-component system, NarL family, response regulator NreC